MGGYFIFTKSIMVQPNFLFLVTSHFTFHIYQFQARQRKNVFSSHERSKEVSHVSKDSNLDNMLNNRPGDVVNTLVPTTAVETLPPTHSG